MNPPKNTTPKFDYGKVRVFRDAKYWVYRRRRTPQSELGKTFHTRISIVSKDKKKWLDIRKCTKKKNLTSAIEEVKEMIIEIKVKIKEGIIVTSRKFKQVSQDYLKDLKSNPSTSKDKLVKSTRIVKLYLNPFFGNMSIDSINEKNVHEYKKWRKSYWKIFDTNYTYIRNGQEITSQRNYLKSKLVTGSTLAKEDSVLRPLIEYARLCGDIPNDKIIRVKSEPVKKNKRPSFTKSEWDKVLKKSTNRCSKKRLWKKKEKFDNRKSYKQTNKDKDKVHQTTLNQRILLHDYINFMVGSGLRTTESHNIKWKHISSHSLIEEKSGKFKTVSSVKLSVFGKDKQRKCDPQPYVKEILDRVKKRQKEFSLKNEFSFKGKDEYVWSDEYGNQVKSFSKSFTNLLSSCDLLYDQFNTKRVVGSLRHTYGTFRKNLGEVDTYELAIQMGTSPQMVIEHYVHSDDYDRSTAVTRMKKSVVTKKKKVKKKK